MQAAYATGKNSNAKMDLVLSRFSLFLFFYSSLILGFCTGDGDETGEDSGRYRIEGKVVIPPNVDQEFTSQTRVIVDGGQYLGFLKSDGTFSIGNVASGSYLVEVVNPTFAYEPARVDVTSKGKMRARRVNNLSASLVSTMTYPLKFKARGMASYFQKREQWRVTDFLFNPMVLMMVLPFLMIMVLPKLMNTADPETQKEMQSQMNMLNPKQGMPDLSEMLMSVFGGGSTAKKPAVKAKSGKRRT